MQIKCQIKVHIIVGLTRASKYEFRIHYITDTSYVYLYVCISYIILKNDIWFQLIPTEQCNLKWLRHYIGRCSMIYPLNYQTTIICYMVDISL